MNKLNATEALLEDQRAVIMVLRSQLEDVREQRNYLHAVIRRLLILILVEAQHHGGLPHELAEPILEILRNVKTSS